MPAWRIGLARWTSNPKVVGSTPTVRAYYYILGDGGISTGYLFSLGLSCIKWENIIASGPDFLIICLSPIDGIQTAITFRNSDRVERCANL